MSHGGGRPGMDEVPLEPQAVEWCQVPHATCVLKGEAVDITEMLTFSHQVSEE